jgi:methyl-accepting chemotaxis protein
LLISKVIANEGAGFVRYSWPKPGVDEPKPKVAYVAAFKPWGWIVGTGIFIDDFDAKTSFAFARQAGIGIVIGGLVAAVAFLLARGIVTPLGRAVKTIDRLAAGDLRAEITDAKRADEIGSISRGLVELKHQATRRVELETETEETRRVAHEARIAHEAEREGLAKELANVVSALAAGLAKLSAGDLTFRINNSFSADYEKLRTDFNAAISQLQETMKIVAQNAGGIRSGTGDISQAADDLSRRTEQQAASLEETAAALDEITATVKHTAEGARHARDVVSNAKADAETGGAVVRQAIEAMSGIERSSQQIGQIIGVIDEIAFQTNLLALNAGVEAARAGEAGRGFAVVASEVRALAQRSAEAAKEIKGLISGSTAQVGQGVDLVGETGKALDRIIVQVAELNGVVTDIAASAQEQSTGLNEVNTAVNQMDQTTQQNAAMVEQTNAASRALAQETEELTRLIGRFEIGQQPATVVPLRRQPNTIPPGQPTTRKALKTVSGRNGGAAQRKAEPAAEAWEEF